MSADPIERLAIELRQIDAEDAAHGRDAGTRKRNWDGASEWLKDEYRKQARRLLRFIAAGPATPASAGALEAPPKDLPDWREDALGPYDARVAKALTEPAAEEVDHASRRPY